MKPYEFEQLVCDHYNRMGYRATTTSLTGDYGVDVFAEKENEKIGVQAKMYGGSVRKVNRQTMMELYGAAAYFDCTKAVLATDGEVLADAKEVANKLGIEILFIQPDRKNSMSHIPSSKWNLADIVWEKYIMPLAGKTLTRGDGKSNRIVNVDWRGIERITSNGKHQKIEIEIFRSTIDRLLRQAGLHAMRSIRICKASIVGYCIDSFAGPLFPARKGSRKIGIDRRISDLRHGFEPFVAS